MSKSAAELKVIKTGGKKNREKAEANFQTSKEGLLITLNTQISLSKGINDFIGLRDMMEGYYQHENRTVEAQEVIDVRDLRTRVYEQMKAIVESFTFEQFIQDEEKIEDPFKHLIDDYSDMETWDEILVPYVEFMTIKPFAEKVFQIHQLVWKDIRGE